jgi:hypothetical protein
MSEKFIKKFFDKICVEDFKNDKFLLAFYNCYVTSHQKDPNLTLFNFYTEYLIRNKNVKENLKDQEINKIYDEIKNTILNSTEQSTKSNSIDQNTKSNSTSTKIKISKKNVLTVLSDFIKQSFIIIYDNPNEFINEDDENFKNIATDNIIEEIKRSIGSIPIGKKDPAFGRRNDMLVIWQDTENKCNKFLQMGNTANILKKIFFLSEIDNLNKKYISTIEIKDSKEVIFPSENIMSKYEGTIYNTKISVINTNPLTTILDKIKTTSNIALVINGSKMIPGGGADQGFDTNETPIYYSSTYNLCLNQINYAYPLGKNQMFICPNVLVFKDHNNNYNLLLASNSQRITVINSPSLYKPKTTIIDQEQYEFDMRLYSTEVKYQNTQVQIDKLNTLFNNALVFGYTTLVIDDGGIENFWLPAMHTILLINQVLNDFKGKFKEIIFCIENPILFKMYKTIISK